MANDNEKKEDDIVVDFSKIKSFFGRKKTESASTGASINKEQQISEDADEKIDFKGISSQFERHKSKIIPATLIIIAIFFAIFLRATSYSLPVTDDWAKNTLENNIKNQIGSRISQQYPNLPAANKQALIESEFAKVATEQKESFAAEQKRLSEYFKSTLKDDDGQTYSPDLDPYFWLRFAKNIVDTGKPHDEDKNGLPWDSHMMAPSGRPLDESMGHPYILAYMYKIIHAINPKYNWMTVSWVTAAVLMALAVIPAFFIARKVGGNLGGFIASVLVVIHPAALTRTSASDTDAYNILMPLLVVWLFLEAIEHKDLIYSVILSALSGLFLGIYSDIWIGWWYIIGFVFAASAIYVIYYLVIYREHFKTNIFNLAKEQKIQRVGLVILLFIISSALFVTIFSGFDVFLGIIKGPMSFVTLKEVGITKVWPNVFTTVAEQNAASLQDVTNTISFGKWYLLWIGLLGLVLMMKKKEMKPKDYAFWIASGLWYIFMALIPLPNITIFMILALIPVLVRVGMSLMDQETSVNIKTSIIFAIWILATLYASTKGIRFTLLLVPAFAVTFGAGVGILYNYFKDMFIKELGISKPVAKTALVFCALLLMVQPMLLAMDTAKGDIPMMNDAWWNSLSKIDKEGSADAIINSWWDYGHWFKMVGNRAVTFDGTSQDTPQAHWIGKALLTDDEDTSVGILRMLDCSGYAGGSYAFTYLLDLIRDHPKTVNIMNEVMVTDKDHAKQILLKYGLTEEQADKEISYTHCVPPDNYFIVSDDMIGKSGVWAHFGSWNFDRALMYNTIKRTEYSSNEQASTDFLKSRFNMTEQEALKIYHEIISLDSDAANSWIAPWPSFASGLTGCIKNNGTYLCGFSVSNGQLIIEVDIRNETAVIQGNKGKLAPQRLVIAKKEGFKAKDFTGETLDIGLVMIPTDEENYAAILASPEIASSMFTRLFFMEGYGLKHFDKFSDEKSITGNRIIVYKVNWEGGQPNQLDFFNEQEDVNTNNYNITETEPANGTEQ